MSYPQGCHPTLRVPEVHPSWSLPVEVRPVVDLRLTLYPLEPDRSRTGTYWSRLSFTVVTGRFCTASTEGGRVSGGTQLVI